MKTGKNTVKRSRHANGEGSVVKRRDGRWEARIMDGYTKEGKPHIISRYGHTRAEVIKKLDVLREERKDGMEISNDMLFKEWCDIWYRGHKNKVSPVTYEGYRYTVENIKELLGNEKLRDIRTMDVENALQTLQESGASDSKVKKVRGMLYQIFSKAAANDLIRRNPVEFADKIRSRGEERKKDIFTPEEIDLIMKRLPEDRLGWSIRLLVGTGMREQELLALEPVHIEKDGSVIHVRQAVKRIGGSVGVGCTKTKDSVRDIPVPKVL